MQTHSLYCPKCDEQVEVPFATEVYQRGCPNDKCDCPAAAMWPSRAMYARHQQFEARHQAAAEAAANAPDETGRGPVAVLTPADIKPTHIAVVEEAEADIPGVTRIEPPVDAEDDEEDQLDAAAHEDDDKGGSD